MILIFDGETSSKSMLLLMRRHLVFFRISSIKMGDYSEADLRVFLRNEGRDYNEHFQTYKFYFSTRMTFVNEGDLLIFVADLLNAYGESLEGVFERVFVCALVVLTYSILTGITWLIAIMYNLISNIQTLLIMFTHPGM